MRIDNVAIGSKVTLRLYRTQSQLSSVKFTEEEATFCGIEHMGEDRQAVFVQEGSEGNSIRWDAYRRNGRWVYGSSANRLSLIAVHA